MLDRLLSVSRWSILISTPCLKTVSISCLLKCLMFIPLVLCGQLKYVEDCDWIIYFYIILFAVYCFFFILYVAAYMANKVVYKKRPTFTCSNLDIHDPISIIFWQKYYWECKKSDDTLFSHLTSLVLLQYLAKEETQKIAQWCIVVQHSPTAAALTTEPCPQQPRAERIDYKIWGVSEWVVSQKNIEETKQRLAEFWQCTNTVSEKYNYRVYCFARSTSYLRWHSKAYFDCLLYR